MTASLGPTSENIAMRPVRLRPTVGQTIGTTAFFRNRPLLATLCDIIADSGQTSLSVLFHACSIGAEVYSFLIAAALHPVLKSVRITACATDLEPLFIEMARSGHYERSVLSAMRPEERAFFDEVSDSHVAVCAAIRAKVRILDAASFVTFAPDHPVDLVFLTNALIYVDGDTQRETLRKISGYNTRWLITTAFHMDRIKSDLEALDYRPVLENMRDIHDGWTDRRVDTNNPLTIPNITYHAWNLPEFSHIEDYEYKYSSIFKKGSGYDR